MSLLPGTSDSKIFIKHLIPWNYKDIFILQGSWYIMDGIIFLFRQINIPGLVQLSQFFHLLFLSAGRFMLVPLILFWVKIYYDLDNLSLGLSLNWKLIKKGLLAVLPFLMMVILLVALPVGLKIFNPGALMPVYRVRTPEEIAMSLVYLLLISFPVLPAAFTEELFFRGFCYPYFEFKLGPFLGGIFSALYYSLVLLDFNQLFIVHFLVGLLTTYLFQKTRSIIPGVIFQTIYHSALILYLFGWLFW